MVASKKRRAALENVQKTRHVREARLNNQDFQESTAENEDGVEHSEWFLKGVFFFEKECFLKKTVFKKTIFCSCYLKINLTIELSVVDLVQIQIFGN